MRYASYLLVVVVLSGCASASGLAVSVPTAPGSGQTTAQLDRDAAGCAKEVAGKERVEPVYAACMIARGYWTTVNVRGAWMDVFGGMSRQPVAIASDVETCRHAPRQPTSERAFGAMLIAGQAAFEGVLAQEAFAACMTPRGYDVRPWNPDLSKKR